MKSLKEELRENFKLEETKVHVNDYTTCNVVNSDLESSHNLAINDIVKKLKKSGVKKIKLAYSPSCYVADMRNGTFRATVYMLKE